MTDRRVIVSVQACRRFLVCGLGKDEYHVSGRREGRDVTNPDIRRFAP